MQHGPECNDNRVVMWIISGSLATIACIISLCFGLYFIDYVLREINHEVRHQQQLQRDREYRDRY